MKNIIAAFTLACVASAATLAPLAVCNAKRGESCVDTGQRGCENNGGHSMLCVTSSAGKFKWIYADNCPDSDQHCDCADGLCKPN